MGRTFFLQFGCFGVDNVYELDNIGLILYIVIPEKSLSGNF